MTKGSGLVRYVQAPARCNAEDGERGVRLPSGGPLTACRVSGASAAGRRAKRPYPNAMRHPRAGSLVVVRRAARCRSGEKAMRLSPGRKAYFCVELHDGGMRWVKSWPGACRRWEFAAVMRGHRYPRRPTPPATVNARPDSAGTGENEAVNVDVLGNDTPARGLEVVSIDREGLRGSASVNPDGTIRYAPNGRFEGLPAGQSVQDSFAYRASNGRRGDSARVTMTVTGANDAPVLSGIESGAQGYVDGTGAVEITSAVDVSDVDDANLDAAQVSIGSGRDAADELQFDAQNGITGSYDSGTGVLTLTGSSSKANYRAALRSVRFFSSGAPSGGRSVRFRVGDGAAASNVATRTVAVNRAPTDLSLTDSSVDENSGSGAEVGTLSATDPDSGDSHSFSLVGGPGDTDNAAFAVDGDKLDTTQGFDFESDSSYSVRVRADDGKAGTFEKQLTVSVANVNDGPTDITISDANVDENQPSGTPVGTLSTTDQDAGDTFTYSLVSGTGDGDNGSFQISGSDLQTAGPFDFEADSSYSVRVRSTDAGGQTTEKQLTITVTNANDTPTALALSPGSVAENESAGTSAGTLTTTDQDSGETFTYSLVAGTGDGDNASFEVDGNRLETKASFDRETKASYSVRVRSTDSGGKTTEQQFTVGVTNVNEAPTDIALNDASVEENAPVGTVVGNLSSTDVDAGDSHTYSLVSGTGSADNGAFEIDGGQLKTKASFNFESDDSYAIRVQTTDAGGLTHEKQLTVTIANVNDGPTDITLSNASVNENAATGTGVGTLSTQDQDTGDAHTYTLVMGIGDADNSSFQISGNQLQTNASFNFEADSSYSVRLRSTDAAGATAEKQFDITVANVNDTPTAIALSPGTIAENAAVGTSAGTLSTTDQDAGDTFSYDLVAGTGDADNASFTVDGDRLETNAGFDFETDASYSVRVRSTDAGGATTDQQLTVSVTNVNDAPTAIALSDANVDENEPAGELVGTLSTTDQDSGDSHTYTLVTGTGDTDNASFEIDGTRLEAKGTLDFETKSSYTVRVRSTDSSGATAEEQFALTVLDANDKPTALTLGTSSVPENQPSDTAVGTFSTTDQDSAQTHTYELVSGTGDGGNSSFEIVGGELRTDAMFNREAQSSYSIRVRTTDNGSPAESFTETFTITVSNVNEAPTDIALSDNSIAEGLANGSVVGSLSSTDVDASDSHTYTLVNGAGDGGNAGFTIDGSQLKTAASFDFEGQTSYSIRVQSTDAGGLTTEKQFTINVTDVNEAPTDIGLSSSNYANNAPSGTTIGNFSTVDQDAGDSHSYLLVSGSGDSGNSAFEIDGNTLKANATLTANSYSIRVESTDNGGLSHVRNFTIVGNQDPTDIALSNSSVAENQPASTTVGSLSNTDPDNPGAGQTHTYALATGPGDTNNGQFEIDGTTLKTATPLNREADPTRDIRIRVTDSAGGFYEETLAITITDANDAPTAITLSNNTVAENQASATPVGNLSTTDEDSGDTHTYSLATGTGDTDNAQFQISGNQLQTNTSFNYEAKSSYQIRIRTTDNGTGTLSHEQQFTVSVTDANDTPTDITLSPASIPENQPSGTAVGSLTTTDQDSAQTHTYTLVNGAGDGGNAAFTIDGTQLKTAASFDFEDQTSYSIRVRATDSAGATFDKQLTVTVTNVNEAPTDLGLSTSTIAENQPPGTAVGQLLTDDPDAGDSHTYTFATGTGDTDNGQFTIDGNQLKTAASFNFEAKSSYTVRVKTTDAGGADFTEALTVTVTDVNEAPSDIALDDNSVDENLPSGTPVGNFSATDPDSGQTHTYTLVAGAGSTDNGSFQIVSGQLRTNAVLNFEAKSTYQIRVRATDNGSPAQTYDEQMTVDVTDVNEAPTPTNDSFSGSNSAVPNTSFVGDGSGAGTPDPAGPQKTITANILANDTDPDTPPQTLEVVPVTGANTNDGGKVDIEADGDFTFYPAPSTSCTDSSDFFDYTVTDKNTTKPPGTAATGTGRVTVALLSTTCPWYIDNSQASNGNGTSAAPFNTLANVNGAGGAGDADAAGHTLFLYEGNSAYNTGLVLEGTQKLHSESHGLTVPSGGASGTTTIVNANPANNPTIANSAGDALGLAANVDVQGIDLGTTPAASASLIAASSIGTATVNTTTTGAINNPTGGGVNLNANNGAATIAFSSVTAGGGTSGIALQNLGAGGSFTASGGTISGATGPEFDITAGQGTISYGGTIGNSAGDTASVLNRTGGTVTASGNIADSSDSGGRILVSNNSGGSTTFSGAAKTLNTGSGNAVQILNSPNHPVSFTNGGLAITTSDGVGFQATGGGTRTIGTGANPNSITTNGQAVLIGDAPSAAATTATTTVDATFDGGISSSRTQNFSSNTDSIRLEDATGTFTANGGTLGPAPTAVDNSSDAVEISGDAEGTDALDFTYTGGITGRAGRVILVQNQDGGTKTFSGPIGSLGTPTAANVALTDNTGATVNFTGGLNLSTGTTSALAATGGGTLAVTGSTNTLATTTGTALNVANTTIGDSDLNFRSIAASNPTTSGIALSNTSNANGKLIVAGNGSSCTVATPTCTGGSITSADGAGIDLSNVPGGASLALMRVNNGVDDGIRATSVGSSLGDGLALANNIVQSNGDAVGENGLEYNNVLGVSSINNTTSTGSAEFNARFDNDNGTGRLTVDGSSFTSNSTTNGADGMLLFSEGSAAVRARVQNSTFSANRDDGFQLLAGGDSNVDLMFDNNSVSGAGNPGRVSAQASLNFDSNTTSNVRMSMTGGNVSGSDGSAIIVNPAGDSPTASTPSSTFDATFDNVTIGTPGVPGSGSATGIGFWVKPVRNTDSEITIKNSSINGTGQTGVNYTHNDGTGTGDFTFTGNTIRNVGTGNEAVLVRSGSLNTDSITTCADIGGAGGDNAKPPGNDFAGQASPAGITDIAFRRPSSSATSHLRLPGFDGNQANLASYVQGRNVGSPSVTNFSGDLESGPAQCQQPTAPTAP